MDSVAGLKPSVRSCQFIPYLSDVSVQRLGDFQIIQMEMLQQPETKRLSAGKLLSDC